MQIDILTLGPLETNCYLLSSGSEAVVIDPGGDPEAILKLLDKKGLTLTHILNTHLHLDHTYGNAGLAAASGVKIQAGEGEKLISETQLVQGGFYGLPMVEAYDWEPMEPGGHEMLGTVCEVRSTPGHSPGSLTFYFKDAGAAFVGDVIFKGSVGRTDFPGASHSLLIESIRTQIFTLPEDTVLYPGHGSSTTVKREMKSNPYA